MHTDSNPLQILKEWLLNLHEGEQAEYFGRPAQDRPVWETAIESSCCATELSNQKQRNRENDNVDERMKGASN